MPAEEFATLRQSLTDMVMALDDAKHRSMDPPEAPAMVVASHIYTGVPGRPRLEIDENLLRAALAHRGPSGLAEIFHCSSRTVRRRALDHGLVIPGAPVYRDVTDDTATTTRHYSSTTGLVSTLSDNELDDVISNILNIFPTYGHRMLIGSLNAMGHNVPSTRIAASYIRVHGAPATFSDRRIQRRKYSVPGPMSLVHHDGQHGVYLLYQDL